MVRKDTKKEIINIKNIRTGGQIALKGYSYQLLYTTYLILSEFRDNVVFQLEGIEDIDMIEHNVRDINGEALTTHIQLKYSKNNQDASFLKTVLKNFLEVYLLDSDRNFKLIYDFQISKGNLSKLINNNLDESAYRYWKDIIQKIEKENTDWNWLNFDYDDFISKLSFENKKREVLEKSIEELLISNFNITTDNILLYANSIKIFCFNRMVSRENITKRDLESNILEVQDDINKGPFNPAFHWIRKINFGPKVNDEANLDYYEGKKPTYQDIANRLPVERETILEELKKSIIKNRVTIIKASSGQGKTTLALQIIYDLFEEYMPYQLFLCNDKKELTNIVSYFETRVRLGEKPLILLDNLDSQLSDWNMLSQLFQEQVKYHYKLVVTAREEDWYTYKGDLTNLKSVNIINIELNKKDAENIFYLLKEKGMLHASIKDWKKSYRNIEKRKLLIEYIYLLTHGEMLSERINAQLTSLANSPNGKIKIDILRKVCFADICGAKILIGNLIENIKDQTDQDPSELLKSLESEYLLLFDNFNKYIEGIHQVRSYHIVERLHEYLEKEYTAIETIKIIDKIYMAQYFSYMPRICVNSEDFYNNVFKALLEKNDISLIIPSIKGVFSASVMNYFYENKNVYDDANNHGGLFILDMELNPFTNFEEIDEKNKTLDNLKNFYSNNRNIDYLIKLRDDTPKIDLFSSDIYLYSSAIYHYFKSTKIEYEMVDINSYSKIIYWLIKIDSSFNLTKNIPLNLIWDKRWSISLESLTSIFYSCWVGNQEGYLLFVENNLDDILIYLRDKTNSVKVYLNESENSIHVEYILLLSEISKGNDESVKRLKILCKALPIFDTYCSRSFKPSLDILSQYPIPDDSIKNIPRRNIIIIFNQEFNSLWSKTILSNYESESISEWLEHWFNIRRDIVNLSKYVSESIYRLLAGKKIGNLLNKIINLYNKTHAKYIKEFGYPNENRPFEESSNVTNELIKIKTDYFQSFINFINQLVDFLQRKEKLAIINLRKFYSSLEKMQTYFKSICDVNEILQDDHISLENIENNTINTLIKTCLYYTEHNASKYFNKYQIPKWYETNKKYKIENAKDKLINLSNEFSVTFPINYYFDEYFSFFPLILRDVNIYDEAEMINLVLLCMDFIETDFDYLIILFSTNNNEVNSNSLKFTRSTFENLHDFIMTNNETLTNKIIPPFPIETTQKMLECFEYEYTIMQRESYLIEGLDSLVEILWAISLLKSILIRKQDLKYLEELVKGYSQRYDLFLKKYSAKISSDNYNMFIELKKSVLNGTRFTDKELNKIIGEIINIS